MTTSPVPSIPSLGSSRVRRADRSGRLVLAAGALAVVALLSSDDGTVLCPYRRCTAGDCPLCGVTRAAGRLLRGDISASWQLHPLAALLAVQLPIAVALLYLGRRERLQQLLVVNLVVAVLLWVGRLAVGEAAPPETLTWPW